jgi:hypothetical protein
VTVTIGIEDREDGARVMAESLTIKHRPGGPSLSSRGIKKLNPASLISEAVHLLMEVDETEVLPRSVVGASAEVRRAMAPQQKGPIGRSGYKPEELRTVAAAHRAAGRGKRYADIGLALDHLPGFRYRPSHEVIKKMIEAARLRTDPMTGSPYLD